MSGPKSPLFGQVFAAAVVTITAVAVTADPRPNILVLVVDDLNGYALREDVHTPHLDALKASVDKSIYPGMQSRRKLMLPYGHISSSPPPPL